MRRAGSTARHSMAMGNQHNRYKRHAYCGRHLGRLPIPNTLRQDAYHSVDGGLAARCAGLKNSLQSIEIGAGDAPSVTSPARVDAGLLTGSGKGMRLSTCYVDNHHTPTIPVKPSLCEQYNLLGLLKRLDLVEGAVMYDNALVVCTISEHPWQRSAPHILLWCKIFQIPPDLVVKFQPIDIIDVIL
jgi:hypothetical protein